MPGSAFFSLNCDSFSILNALIEADPIPAIITEQTDGTYFEVPTDLCHELYGDVLSLDPFQAVPELGREQRAGTGERKNADLDTVEENLLPYGAEQPVELDDELDGISDDALLLDIILQDFSDISGNLDEEEECVNLLPKHKKPKREKEGGGAEIKLRKQPPRRNVGFKRSRSATVPIPKCFRGRRRPSMMASDPLARDNLIFKKPLNRPRRSLEQVARFKAEALEAAMESEDESDEEMGSESGGLEFRSGNSYPRVSAGPDFVNGSNNANQPGGCSTIQPTEFNGNEPTFSTGGNSKLDDLSIYAAICMLTDNDDDAAVVEAAPTSSPENEDWPNQSAIEEDNEYSTVKGKYTKGIPIKGKSRHQQKPFPRPERPPAMRLPSGLQTGVNLLPALSARIENPRPKTSGARNLSRSERRILADRTNTTPDVNVNSNGAHSQLDPCANPVPGPSRIMKGTSSEAERDPENSDEDDVAEACRVQLELDQALAERLHEEFLQECDSNDRSISKYAPIVTPSKVTETGRVPENENSDKDDDVTEARRVQLELDQVVAESLQDEFYCEPNDKDKSGSKDTQIDISRWMSG